MILIGELLFYTLIILLPINIGKHFTISSSYIRGVLVDYYILTIYLTDLILILLGLILLTDLIIIKNIDFRKTFTDILKPPRSLFGIFLKSNHLVVLALFLLMVWSFLTLFTATEKTLAFYRIVRFFGGGVIFLWVLLKVNLKKDFNKIIWALLLGAVIQGIISIFQFYRDGHLFGYYFLGETSFNTFTAGVSKISLFGVQHVRSYGTFPHPNILGAYLSIAISWLLYKISSQKSSKVLVLCFLVLAGGVFVSFSRVAWVITLLGLIVSYIFINKDSFRQVKKLVVILLLLIFPFHIFLFGSLNYQSSLSRRDELVDISFKMIESSPVFGVGFGNFIRRMDDFGIVSGWIRFLQPVHNIYLLYFSETGFPGFLMFVFPLIYLGWLGLRRFWSLYKAPSYIEATGPSTATLGLLVKKKEEDNRRIVFFITLSYFQLLLFGLFDHFLVTLPQGVLLFWLITALEFCVLYF